MFLALDPERLCMESTESAGYIGQSATAAAPQDGVRFEQTAKDYLTIESCNVSKDTLPYAETAMLSAEVHNDGPQAIACRLAWDGNGKQLANQEEVIAPGESRTISQEVSNSRFADRGISTGEVTISVYIHGAYKSSL